MKTEEWLYRCIDLLDKAYEISEYENIVGAKINISKARRSILNELIKRSKHEKS